MTDRTSIDYLEQLAKRINATVTFDGPDDSSYIDSKLSRDGIDVYIILTKFNNRFYAYSLNSNLATSGLYADMQSDKDEHLKARENEIFKNAESILRKEVVYHKTPSLFNRQRGYVELNIDGKPVKLFQKRNLLALPET